MDRTRKARSREKKYLASGTGIGCVVKGRAASWIKFAIMETKKAGVKEYAKYKTKSAAL